jgi:glycosyltransferase involved in cell wall biosynthesis
MGRFWYLISAALRWFGPSPKPLPSAPAHLVHVTSVHNTDDIRIFYKECCSLATEGFRVTLVGPGKQGRTVAGVRIVEIPRLARGRLDRMSLHLLRIGIAVMFLPADIYQIHDPELLVLGLVLKLLRRQVIYDVHEDYPRKILTKNWIPRRFKNSLALATSAIEALAGRLFDAIVGATPTIAARFPRSKTITLCNFPMLEEFSAPPATAYGGRPLRVCYVGGLSKTRGLFDMVRAAGLVQGGAAQSLQLAGRFEGDEEEAQSRAEPGWARVDYLGWLDRPRLAQVMADVRAGLVVLHPDRCFIEAYPIKLFEYMAAGLPVVASDFPVHREILNDGACGLLIAPADPPALARAIEWIFAHPNEAQAMGERGRDRVKLLYTWEAERKKLFELYRRLATPAMRCNC